MANTSGKRVRSISYAKYGYLFILPFFVIYIVFQIYPLFNTFYLSTQSNGSTQTEFVGMDNFKALMIGENATISHGDNAGNKGGRAWRAANGDFKRVMGNTIMLWVSPEDKGQKRLQDTYVSAEHYYSRVFSSAFCNAVFGNRVRCYQQSAP